MSQNVVEPSTSSYFNATSELGIGGRLRNHRICGRHNREMEHRDFHSRQSHFHVQREQTRSHGVHRPSERSSEDDGTPRERGLKLREARESSETDGDRYEEASERVLPDPSTNRAYLDPESVSTRSSLTSERSSYYFSLDDDDYHTAAGDSIVEVEEATSNVMTELRSIAECMIASGYAKECISVYKSIRKSIIDEGVYRLEVEKINTAKAKRMSWEEVELKIRSWLEAVKVSMETLLKERRFFAITSSNPLIRSESLALVKYLEKVLFFSLPSRRSLPSEQARRILRLRLFSGCSTCTPPSPETGELSNLSSPLSLPPWCDLKRSSHSSHSASPSDHSFLNSNQESIETPPSNVLVDILAGSPPPDRTLIPESYFNVSDSDDSPSSELAVRFAWLILVLLCKIDRKANYYKDCSVSVYLFLTNNLHHVVSRARSSNVKQLLGEDWVKRHVDRFEKFSEGFERAYRKQGACVVPDRELRDEIRLSIARKLVPVYREFYNTRRSVILAGAGGVRNLSSVVRFTPEDVENHLSD
ncbi:hypothetical protein Bca52824_067148 [Brassica carinata]|uniref:Exocyst subunit Exo70 family protein n=1 Tax=Brassica carinata TaxID=52824 RepID=A0A8X7QMT4_BRACI|nr:hypothetical protein Bca52824_067148 [Brassica carinata]